MKVVSGLFSVVSTLAAQLMEAIKVFQYGTKVLHVAKKKKGGGVLDVFMFIQKVKPTFTLYHSHFKHHLQTVQTLSALSDHI